MISLDVLVWVALTLLLIMIPGLVYYISSMIFAAYFKEKLRYHEKVVDKLNKEMD